MKPPRIHERPWIRQRCGGEAEHLAALAASLPTDVQKANQGAISKDLIPRLEEIEKLSKHLRAELNH